MITYYITGSSLSWLSVNEQNIVIQPRIATFWKNPGKALETSESWNDAVYFPEMHKQVQWDVQGH